MSQVYKLLPHIQKFIIPELAFKIAILADEPEKTRVHKVQFFGYEQCMEYEIPLDIRIAIITSQLNRDQMKRGDTIYVPRFGDEPYDGIYFWDGDKVITLDTDDDLDEGRIPRKFTINEFDSAVYWSEVTCYGYNVSFDVSKMKIISNDIKTIDDKPHYICVVKEPNKRPWNIVSLNRIGDLSTLMDDFQFDESIGYGPDICYSDRLGLDYYRTVFYDYEF